MTRLTDNVQVQEQGEPLLRALRQRPDPAAARSLVHVVSPYECPEGSEGARVQQLTFQTMDIARELAGVPVQTIAVRFPDERVPIPLGFHDLPRLDRSALDLRRFRKPRRLPLLFDVLSAAAEAAGDADTMIFTNVDICLMPHFYLSIRRLLELGHDVLIVNRRTIHAYGFDPHLLPAMFADYGAIHPGFDTFVFPTAMVARFVRSDACLGAWHVMPSLIYNLVAMAQNMLILRDVHLTFHVGADRGWRSRDQFDYLAFNLDCAEEVYAAHAAEPQIRERLESFREAYAGPFTIRRKTPG